MGEGKRQREKETKAVWKHRVKEKNILCFPSMSNVHPFPGKQGLKMHSGCLEGQTSS